MRSKPGGGWAPSPPSPPPYQHLEGERRVVHQQPAVQQLGGHAHELRVVAPAPLAHHHQRKVGGEQLLLPLQHLLKDAGVVAPPRVHLALLNAQCRQGGGAQAHGGQASTGMPHERARTHPPAHATTTPSARAHHMRSAAPLPPWHHTCRHSARRSAAVRAVGGRSTPAHRSCRAHAGCSAAQP